MNFKLILNKLFGKTEPDDDGDLRIGSWSQSYSGSKYWVLDPKPKDINLIDIVTGLANASRYRGQTQFYYSVLTHCVLVSRAVERLALERGWPIEAAREAALEGLLHDGSEAYIGDVARPLKKSRVMKAYCKLEKSWEAAIRERFDIETSPDYQSIVDECDKRIVLDEVKAIMRDPDMWRRNGRYLDLKPLDVEIPEWSIEDSHVEFYKRYYELRPY